MTRSRLLLSLAAVFAGLAAVLFVLGVVYSLIALPVALLFGATAYLLWYHATGRLVARMRRRAARESRQTRAENARRAGRSGPGDGSGRQQDQWEWATTPTTTSTSKAYAARVLGVSPDADQATIRRAYRERAKEVHPDAENGSEEAFKEAAAAYERLRER